MLREISIRDVVLIDTLDLELGQGFIVLTGETGAGKSILLDALGLTLGERADKGLVRDGAQRALASATFGIKNNALARDLVTEFDIDVDSDELILRRSVGLDGKSRAFINDMPISVTTMRKISQSLIEIHGQHSAIGLMDISAHLSMLDGFAVFNLGDKFLDALRETKSAFDNLRQKEKQLDEAKKAMGQSGAEREYLAHVLASLQNLNPQIGEEKTLDENRRFLMGSERVLSSIKEANTAIEGGKVENNMGNAARALSKIGKIESDNAARLNETIENAQNSLERAQNEIADCLGYLNQAGLLIDLDPKELEQIEERLFALRGAARKHNVSIDELPNVLAQTAQKLEMIDNSDEFLLLAQKQHQQALKDYQKQAQALSELRQIAAKEFAHLIEIELPPLKLEKMRFRVTFESDIARIGANGIDKARFEIAPNPGAGFGGLDAIASGGELSRLSLALKVVLSSSNGTLALVFDEVDQGIGGATADAVGKRLRALAKNSQVICVTHSPQVAARAHQHLRIEKQAINGKTTTNVKILSDNERLEEVARMLAGEDITIEARAAAQKLMETTA
jgi:DNA repair protein RecN (Recombination protein N)